MDCIRETAGWNTWQSLNLIIEYDLSIVNLPQDTPLQPAASAGIHIICPQAVVHLCVQPALQPHAEHALVVWRVAVGAVRC
jgi:hypothetical protein